MRNDIDFMVQKFNLQVYGKKILKRYNSELKYTIPHTIYINMCSGMLFLAL